MEKQNVVFITPSFKTGGGNRVFIELANETCNEINVRIVFPNNSRDKHTFYLHDSIYVKAVGTPATSKLLQIRNILKCIFYLKRYHRNDILIISDPVFSIFASVFLQNKNWYRFIQADDYAIYDDGLLLGKKIFLKLYKILCKWSYKQKNNFIFNSKYTYDQYLKYSNKNIPYKLVHPAINHCIFKEKDVVATENIMRICLVARKHPVKGLISFINVFNSLPEQIRNRLKVRLISHDDLSSFKISNMDIINPGSDQEIANIYNDSDIFISTSWWEGFGLPPLEAMACGCAAIISNSGGVNEYARPNENCLMFEVKNEKELMNCIILLLENKNIRSRLALQGKKDAIEFSWKKSANQLLKIILHNDNSIHSNL
jgi:glycosyltransferase involved in cell wall biosynthesis